MKFFAQWKLGKVPVAEGLAPYENNVVELFLELSDEKARLRIGFQRSEQERAPGEEERPAIDRWTPSVPARAPDGVPLPGKTVAAQLEGHIPALANVIAREIHRRTGRKGAYLDDR